VGQSRSQRDSGSCFEDRRVPLLTEAQISLARAHRLGHEAQGFRQLHRLGPLGLAQVAVARGQRQAVLGAPRLAADDLDGQRELSHHVADRLQLLVVLFADHREARLHAGEELAAGPNASRLIWTFASKQFKALPTL